MSPQRLCLAVILLLSLGALSVRSVASQEPSTEQQEEGTRAGELEARRRARLDTVKPAKRSKLVDVLTTMENDGFDQLVTFQRRHFRFGFGKISPVSGLTPGVQYERPRIGATPLTLRTAAAYSVRGYQAYEFQLGKFDYVAPYDILGDGFLGAPFEWDNRSEGLPERFAYFEARYTDQPREEFFGLGGGSLEEQRTDFGMAQGLFSGVAGYQITRWAGFLARGGLFAIDLDEGTDDGVPEIDSLFNDASAPGLAAQPNFALFDAGLYFSWEGDPNLPAAGIGLRLARVDDVDQELYQFSRASLDARAVLPLGSRQRSLAFRAFASRDDADEGSSVPFYLMRTLGGHDTLRGFRNFRFRDTHQLYLSAEYRWEAAAGMELALFYDTGKVFSDSAELNFDNLKNTFGFGVRGKSMRRVVFRLDVGHSSEGTFAYVAFGPAF